MTITAKKERPILFSGPMVRAILAGRKTQTRRVMNPQPTHRIVEGRAGLTIGMDPALDGKGWYDADGIGPGRLVACPYGGIGDRMWVRETWAPMCRTADPTCWCETDEDRARHHYVEYRADTGDARPGGWDAAPDDLDAPRWRPSIHMPRWACRLVLELTGVRVERLHEISAGDIAAEGVTIDGVAEWTKTPWTFIPTEHAAWRTLWDSLNAERGYGWDANPWVWVLTFRRVEAA